MPLFSFLALASLCTLSRAAPRASPSSRCVGTISSLSDVTDAVQCTIVNINAFTVPAGETFTLDLLDSTTVNVLGEIQFGNISWAGPLFDVKGNNITFNGNGQIWDGGGPFYWDGLGTNGGVTKPHPMMKIEMSGTMSDVYVVNAPARCFSLNNPGPLVVSGIIVDDSQGNYPNANSSGLPAGKWIYIRHNTDGFDVSANDLVIENSTVINQDDCLAINRGQNIVFKNNYCNGGHGISIGSITSNVVVEGVLVQGNTVVNSQQAFRIKTDEVATNSSVSQVTYTDNVATNCTEYGVLITQSYPASLGTPGNGVIISDVNFYPGMTTLTAASDADMVAVNCGVGSCTGTWNWSGLKTSGGEVGPMNNVTVITGYTQ